MTCCTSVSRIASTIRINTLFLASVIDVPDQSDGEFVPIVQYMWFDVSRSMPARVARGVEYASPERSSPDGGLPLATTDGHVGPATWPAHSVGLLGSRAERMKMIACGGTKTFHAGYTAASWPTSFRSRQAGSTGLLCSPASERQRAAGRPHSNAMFTVVGLVLLGQLPSTVSGPVLTPSPYLDAAATRVRCHGRRAYITWQSIPLTLPHPSGDCLFQDLGSGWQSRMTVDVRYTIQPS